MPFLPPFCTGGACGKSASLSACTNVVPQNVMPKSVRGFRATFRCDFLIERRIQISGRSDLKSDSRAIALVFSIIIAKPIENQLTLL
jgi:hypothetical protein